ncbi:hypothetical protein BGZ54_000912 [Gamsiella multidivaricata]|nr:hypothetical protein BGZ54_000912 [Gamsiella multidivaricata]
MVLKVHKWEARRARDAGCETIASRLLKSVGGSIGCRRKETNKVVIVIGLGQFSSNARLSSLHESFMSYFVQKVRSLGYIVVGVNEYYILPVCEQSVAQVEIRRLYYSHCKTSVHRDVMTGHNIGNAVRGHLVHQQQPLYLQPVD